MVSAVQQLARLDGRTLADLAHATFELALARLHLKSRTAETLIASVQVEPASLDDDQAALVGRVAVAIPRVASRLPWRADCLVQALAAEHWLARSGIASALHIGVRNDRSLDFEAHAWLTAGDRVVTGGDIADYLPLARI